MKGSTVKTEYIIVPSAVFSFEETERSDIGRTEAEKVAQLVNEGGTIVSAIAVSGQVHYVIRSYNPFPLDEEEALRVMHDNITNGKKGGHEIE